MKKKSKVMLYGFAAFMGTSAIGIFAAASDGEGGIVETARDGVENIIDTTIGGVVDGIDALVGTFFAELNNVYTVAFDLITAPVDGILLVVNSLFEQASGVVTTIFTGEATGVNTGIAVTNEFVAQTHASGYDGSSLTVLGVPSIGWAILGMMFAGIGITLLTGTDFGLIGGFFGGLGSLFVVIGSMLGIWGFFPHESRWLFGLVFGGVFFATVYQYTDVFGEVLGEEADDIA